jgi:hypothetical protein
MKKINTKLSRRNISQTQFFEALAKIFFEQLRSVEEDKDWNRWNSKHSGAL